MNYRLVDSFLIKTFEEKESVFVDRIIDGDTIKANGESIRLLGINSPEKGEMYHNEAKEFLKNKIFNKTVYLEFGKIKYDKYNRKLAYVFLDKENINLKLVEKGFANFYFPFNKDKYYSQFKNAWIKCVKNNINLCQNSENNKCIYLESFDYKNEIIVLKNICNINIQLSNWTIKDEGRKKFYFPEFILKGREKVKIIVGKGTNNENTLFWDYDNYVWTKTGDTIFLRDDKEKLIFWENY